MIVMSRKSRLVLITVVLSALPFVGFAKISEENKWIKTALNRSGEQLLMAAEKYKNTQQNPRTFENGKVIFAGYKDWTCGFFPGSLWFMYEFTKNEKFKTEAEYYTNLNSQTQYRKETHDLGFMLYCSYGNGYRITKDENYKKVLLTGAKSLESRFHPQVGLIKSWESRKQWQYPVIIDNMMNLEFLMEVSKMTGNEKLKEICISHADKTMKNHYREDNSSFHVVDYDSISGNIIQKQTAQGYADNSSWARGQAWGLYGFTMMYRETKDSKYLEQAKKIAAFILNNPTMPKDLIPYWDYNAPKIPNEPRDASAAAIVASALIELDSYVKNNPDYLKTAETILKNLTTEEYLAPKGENGLFILKHSTGNWPRNSEVDVPLNYADYYYLEALGRYMKVKHISLN
jgi:unsaturated chondroitin disaccharide hydrolase